MACGRSLGGLWPDAQTHARARDGERRHHSAPHDPYDDCALRCTTSIEIGGKLVGQKIHPEGLRLGYIKDWESRWFNLRQMPELLEEDRRIRLYLKRKLQGAAVSKIIIERAGKHLRVNIHTARPGIVIGKKGADIENLRKDIESMTDRKAFVN